MTSPVRRAFLLLRQHFLLLGGPWLAVCAAGSVLGTMVQQIMIRLYPVVYYRDLRAAGYANADAAIQNSMRGNYIRLAAVECVSILEYAFKVIALAVMVLVVARIVSEGTDTFSAGLERFRKIPAVVGTLLKFYAIVLAIGLGTSLVATLPVMILVPLWVRWHMPPGFPRWIPTLSGDLGTLLFVFCVMPFLLDLVWRLLRQSADEEVPPGLLARALGYGVVAFGAEAALAWAMRPLRLRLATTQPMDAQIGHSAIGLSVYLITSLPTIVCIVAIALLVLGAAEPVTEAEPA